MNRIPVCQACTEQCKIFLPSPAGNVSCNLLPTISLWRVQLRTELLCHFGGRSAHARSEPCFEARGEDLVKEVDAVFAFRVFRKEWPSSTLDEHGGGGGGGERVEEVTWD